jgi:uncharacterized protein YheU (UPF0270 family)
MGFHAKAVGTVLAGIVILSTQGQAAAHDFPRENPISSREILAHCAKPSEWCRGYILGMVDTMLDAETMDKRIGPFCLPEGTFTSDVTRAVFEHLKTTQSQERGKGAFIIMDALHTKFPCKAH